MQHHKQVKYHMEPKPVFLKPTDTVEEAARKMENIDCGIFPVGTQEKVEGMITDRDITVRTVAEGKNPLELTVSDAMTANAITVTPLTSLEDCCNLMESNQVRRVAVIDEKGACCGIIAQADIAVNGDQRKTAEVVQEVSKATGA